MAIEKVLLALGGSDHERIDPLVQTTLDLAVPTDAEVILSHVYTEEEFDDVVENLRFEDSGDTTAVEAARRESVVRDVGDRLDEAGVSYRVASRIAEYGDGVVDIAEAEDVDMVIVGGRQRSPTGKAVFGSTAQQVMLSSPAPVTFVRAD